MKGKHFREYAKAWKKEGASKSRHGGRKKPEYSVLSIPLTIYYRNVSNGIISDFECNKIKLIVLWVVWRE